MGPCAGGNRPQQKPIDSIEPPNNQAPPQVQPTQENPDKLENREQPYIENNQQGTKPPEIVEESRWKKQDKPQNTNEYPTLQNGGANVYEEIKENKEEPAPIQQEYIRRAPEGQQHENPNIVVVDRNEERQNERSVEVQATLENLQAKSSQKKALQPEVVQEESEAVPDEHVQGFKSQAIPIDFAIRVG